ncbi:MAG: formate dehydrogenase [Desulfobacteraceae bacterium]|nr:formate dehydrogenase [Desulfobacteraceae bacterium]
MSKSFFIDTTLCTACRGCQVACKQWHDLPAEKTSNSGSYQNPADLSFETYKLVRFNEKVIDGKLNWLFFPDQCRHCIEPPCRDVATDPEAIFKDPATGAVIFTANTKNLDAEEIIDSCPYDIPRKAKDGTLAKCDMCLDRVQNGQEPACVKTCPAGAMHFGETGDMLSMAKKRLGQVKQKFPKANLLDADLVQTIYLTAYDPALYAENAIASATNKGIIPPYLTRQEALQKMFKPFIAAAKELV